MKELYLSESILNKMNYQITFCLYSHDPRLITENAEVYEMIENLSVESCDDNYNDDSKCTIVQDSIQSKDDSNVNVFKCSKLLSYEAGDHVMVKASSQFIGRQGCSVGLNLETGMSGIVNLDAGRRIPYSHTWVLHRSYSLHTKYSDALNSECCINELAFDHERKASQHSDLILIQPSSSFSKSSTYDATIKTVSSIVDKPGYPTSSCFQVKSFSTNVSANELGDLSPSTTIFGRPRSKSLSQISTHCWTKCLRQLYVMRHAERIDMCFGQDWIAYCFDDKGIYRRSNLNLPPWLPARSNYMDYVRDSPITQVGLFVSAETGRALASAGVQFSACYCSPALRCIQTATELLHAMGRSDLSIRVEPHLFEWLEWYGNCFPSTIDLKTLKSAGYPIDVDYKSLTSVDEINPKESIAQYYQRTALLVKRLLGVHKSKSSCLLIVAHASSLDTCTRHLVSNRFRHTVSPGEFNYRTSGVPFCGFIVARENMRWSIIQPPVPNVCSYSRNGDFDWRQVLLSAKFSKLAL